MRFLVTTIGDSVTVLIEEKYGGPGSYLTPTSDELDELITLLTIHRTNSFQGRNSSKPDRRQETRRQGDKTKKKLKQLNPVCDCGAASGGMFWACPVCGAL